MTKPTRGAIAAGHKVTAEAAAEILQDGGNAFDAVLAGLMTTCAAEVVFSSLGGGGFLMAQTPKRKGAVLYDFFANTPLAKRPGNDIDFYAINVEFGPATQEFHIGAGSTAIPGFVPGLFAVHRDLCRLPFARLAEPAIRAAREGITMSAFQAYLFQVVAPILQANKDTKQYFAPSGDLLKEGDIYKNPQFANTLEALAREGESFFREGNAAKAIAEQSASLGGHLTLDDLKNYQVIKRKPLTWRYHNSDITLNPGPAASGPLIAFGLGHLETTLSDGNAPGVTDLAATMLATNQMRDNWADELTTITDPKIIASHIEAMADHQPAYRGTTQISVIDEDGNAASATVSNGEGNGRIVNNMGFMLNNMLGEEDLNPAGFHNWKPNTRLSTMMAPTLMTAADGTITALGSGGSNRIRTAILQVIVNLIDHGMTLQDAISEPRLHLEKCGTLSFEDCLSADQKDALTKRYPDAHAWPERNFFFGGVNAVQRLNDGSFAGTGDTRRDGVAILQIR